MVTRRGADAAVALSMDDFLALSGALDSDLVDFFRTSPLSDLPEDLLTRNTKGMEQTGTQLLNPWES